MVVMHIKEKTVAERVAALKAAETGKTAVTVNTTVVKKKVMVAVAAEVLKTTVAVVLVGTTASVRTGIVSAWLTNVNNKTTAPTTV